MSKDAAHAGHDEATILTRLLTRPCGPGPGRSRRTPTRTTHAPRALRRLTNSTPARPAR